jgi:Thymidylate synthase
MHVIRVKNVNNALLEGLKYLQSCGQTMPSRAGDVIVAPGPVTTVYERPTERVLFSPARDANPFLHFFEALHMLAGRNDVGFLTNFVKRFAEYSDDGMTLRGAYGNRWRHHWGFDQVERVIERLRRDPYDRRSVIMMFDPTTDLVDGNASLDIPCNLQVCFRVTYGRRDEANRLQMMTTARSHDAIWGAYGANAVHFSYLQEYVAARLGLVPGNYTQVSWNFHAYRAIYDDLYAKLAGTNASNLYLGSVSPFRTFAFPDTWDAELKQFLYQIEGGTSDTVHMYKNYFFPQVAHSLWQSHVAYKEGHFDTAIFFAENCVAEDWSVAAIEWLERRRIRSLER